MKYLILLTITLLTAACQKEKIEPYDSNGNSYYFNLHIITIQGKLVNSLTHAPIPNQKLESGSGIQMHSYATTDSTGNFTLESKWFEGDKYSVSKTTVFTIVFSNSQNQVIQTIDLHDLNASDTLRNVIIEIAPSFEPGATSFVETAGEVN